MAALLKLTKPGGYGEMVLMHITVIKYFIKQLQRERFVLAHSLKLKSIIAGRSLQQSLRQSVTLHLHLASGWRWMSVLCFLSPFRAVNDSSPGNAGSPLSESSCFKWPKSNNFSQAYPEKLSPKWFLNLSSRHPILTITTLINLTPKHCTTKPYASAVDSRDLQPVYNTKMHSTQLLKTPWVLTIPELFETAKLKFCLRHKITF